MKTLKFEVSLTFSEKMTDDGCILDIAKSIADGILNQVETRGVVPDYADGLTETISVKPQFIDEVITIDLQGVKGKFVNDGNDYQVHGYVFRAYFNKDEGFKMIEVSDFDGNEVVDLAGVKMITEEDDIETIKKFEDVVYTLLKGQNLV